MENNTSNISLSMLKTTQFKKNEFDSSVELEKLLGLDKFTPTKSSFIILSKTQNAEYTLYDIKMSTEPGVDMPFFMLIPPDVEIVNNLPVIIVPHGHGSDGRYGVCGIYRHNNMKRQQEKYNHDIGIQFVKRGYIVLCPDSRGAGDRRNIKEQGTELNDLLSSSCTDLNNTLISLGSSITGANCWDTRCLIDLIIENKWGDSNKIGICGFSGGGLQALIYSALDNRIKCTCSSGYFFNLNDCILETNLCSCNFIPSFSENHDHSSLAMLIAPRPLIIEKGINDPLNGKRGIEGPRELNEIVKDKYEVLKSQDNYKFSEVTGAHSFNGRDVFNFFEKHLKGF